ncbi:DNA-binding transcriptional ArsR family regulator [Litoreibacter meonggei]|uniref:DNA-binding transcriptional ArsR family regulator n=1 Tax=Litoreibacter meonggei TaxID=1049199 RepID=A0A497X4V0_9RHOB|nr:helix-turn-helix transcriptional regulator [Litoreibacter meonggei]RLJ60194.1 DNA-binding transcriptional ArsR family regulator [Litoreibacter meonggei]
MITNDEMDATFHALAHTTRRAILDLVRAEPGVTVGKMASNFDVSRIAVMNHLAVLEKAGLVISGKDGRSRRLYMNVMPIQDVYDRWTDTFSAHWADRLSTIKHAAEAAARKPEEGN